MVNLEWLAQRGDLRQRRYSRLAHEGIRIAENMLAEQLDVPGVTEQLQLPTRLIWVSGAHWDEHKVRRRLARARREVLGHRRVCSWCGSLLPAGSTERRRYCPTSCRKLAYRARRSETATRVAVFEHDASV